MTQSFQPPHESAASDVPLAATDPHRADARSPSGVGCQLTLRNLKLSTRSDFYPLGSLHFKASP